MESCAMLRRRGRVIAFGHGAAAYVHAADSPAGSRFATRSV
jgi:hypothetical protein